MSSLDQLLVNQSIWKASETRDAGKDKFHFLQPDLDKHLNGGLAESGLVLFETISGAGELSFCLPIIKQALNRSGHLALINPLAKPNADWFKQHIGSLDKILTVCSNKPDDHLWAVEQCIISGVCRLVLSWNLQANPKQLRRCHLRARQYQCLFICFAEQFSQNQKQIPCSQYLHLYQQSENWFVDIKKQQAGWARDEISVSHPQPLSNRAINQALCQTYHPALAVQ